MKKLLSMVLCLSMMTALLVGCGSDNTPGTDTPDTGGSQSEAPESKPEDTAPDDAGAEAEEVTVTLGIWPEETLTGDIAMHEGFVATMNSLYPNVTLVPDYYKYATDTFMTKVESGSLPTVFETWFTEPQKLIRTQAVADITDVLEEKGWLDKYTPAMKDLLSDENGRIYGVPLSGYALGLMINVELFEEAGLVDADGYPLYPTSWEDLAEKAKIIKDETGSAGLCLLAKDNAGGWHFSNIAWGFGATLCIENEDGTFTSNLNSPEAIAAMEYVKSLRWEYDVLTADPTAEDWGTGFTNLATGTAAMYIAADNAVNQPTQANGLPLEDLALCPMPAGPAGQYSLFGGVPYVFSRNATAAEISAALDYLTVMGKSPILDAESIAGRKADAQNRVDTGVPVISNFPIWESEEILSLEADIVAEYGNVDPKLYDDYFDAARTTLRPEEPGDTQNMYAELTKVLQAVITDKNADITALMNTANDNYQALLDEF